MNLKINEIYYSIQGESTYTGKPCTFIRFTYCNLRCSWCDSEYTFYEGSDMTIDEIMFKINKYECNLVEVTGGEPLIQEGCILLLKKLISEKYEVLLETGGSLPLKDVPKEVIKIVDFKCPSSNMEKKNLWSILNDLQKHDQIKFVIGNKKDYEWAKDKIIKYGLTKNWVVLLSTVFNNLDYLTLVNWILEDKLNVRFQLQMHKHIWNPEIKGV